MAYLACYAEAPATTSCMSRSVCPSHQLPVLVQHKSRAHVHMAGDACFVHPAMLLQRQAFLQTDQHLREACEGDVSASGRLAEESGTTALAAVIWNQQITVANAGDSRAVLCRHGKAIDLSVDHKPDAPGEVSMSACLKAGCC